MPQVTSKVIDKATTDTERVISVNGYTSVTFDISGTASAADVVFYIIAGSGESRTVGLKRVSGDLDIVDKGTVGAIYSIGTTGISSVKIVISGVTGGNVNVFMTGVS